MEVAARGKGERQQWRSDAGFDGDEAIHPASAAAVPLFLRPKGLNGRRPMTALLLGMGVLLLALFAGALLDPQPSKTDQADDRMPSMDEIAHVA